MERTLSEDLDDFYNQESPEPRNKYEWANSMCINPKCKHEFKFTDKEYRCYFDCYDTISDESAFSYDAIVRNVYCKKCYDTELISWKEDKICKLCYKKMCWKCGTLFGSNNHDEDQEEEELKQRKNKHYYCDRCFMHLEEAYELKEKIKNLEEDIEQRKYLQSLNNTDE